MLLLIFGAGASYDSAPSYRPRSHEDIRPPLANGLFDNRTLFQEVLDEFPECKAIVPELRHHPGEVTVEQVMERLQDEASTYEARHGQLAAIRWYLRVALWRCKEEWDSITRGITCYRTLVDKVEQWRDKSVGVERTLGSYRSVCVVTFNYDTMIEDALRAVGVSIDHVEDYVKHATYKLIKVHGSVNWARQVQPAITFGLNIDTRFARQELIRRAREIQPTDTYLIVKKWESARVEETGIGLIPAIAIPTESGKAFECPAHHLELLTASMPKVTKVLVVGWRGAEQHFVEVLGRVPPGTPGLIVAKNGKAAQEIVSRLQHLPMAWETAQDGFTGSLLDGTLGRYLRG